VGKKHRERKKGGWRREGGGEKGDLQPGEVFADYPTGTMTRGGGKKKKKKDAVKRKKKSQPEGEGWNLLLRKKGYPRRGEEKLKRRQVWYSVRGKTLHGARYAREGREGGGKKKKPFSKRNSDRRRRKESLPYGGNRGYSARETAEHVPPAKNFAPRKGVGKVGGGTQARKRRRFLLGGKGFL